MLSTEHRFWFAGGQAVRRLVLPWVPFFPSREMSGCSVQRWSISLGRWAGVQLRVHIFFLLFAVLAVAFSFRDNQLLIAAFMTLGVVLVSVLLHEAAHALAAVRVGGKVDSIILGPVGGLVLPRVPDEPEVQLFVALAGPLVQLTLVVLAAVGLAASGYAGELLGLFHVMAPDKLVDDGPWLMFGKLMLWWNWVLMWLNLLPAYPFDGGPIFRAMFWPALGRRTARVVTGRAGMVVAVLIAAATLLDFGPEQDSVIEVKLPLAMLGIFLFFSARQDLVSGGNEELFDDETGYRISSDGLDLLEELSLEDERQEAVLVEHRGRQSGQQEQHQRAQEAYEDARVDDILARLHDSSLSQLSREEIEILQRASERYKQRLQSPAHD
jgi:Zn-dependent protease